MSDDENLSVEQIEAWMSQLAVRPPPAAVLQPPIKLFQVQGKVIKINKPLLFFDVQTRQHCARIYLPFYSDIGKLVIFPRIGDKVEISKIKHLKDFYDSNDTDKTTSVLHQGVEIKIKSPTPNNAIIDECENRFLYFLNAHGINEDELINIDEYIVRVVECFMYEGDDILLLLRAIYTELVCDVPSRKDFRVQVRLPIHLKFANTQYDKAYSTLDFHPPSAVNVYPSRNQWKTMTSFDKCEIVTDFLVGTFVVQVTTGRVILRAYSTSILVKFTETSDSLQSIMNALVLIKEYVVITEIFTEQGYPPLIYVLVNLKDVVIVKPSFEFEKRLYKFDEALPMEFIYRHHLEIVKKSDVVVGYTKNKEIWMEAIVKSYCSDNAMKKLPYFSSANSYKAYTIISGELIKLAPILKVRQVYSFFTNIPLKEPLAYIRELKKLNGPLHRFEVPGDALFQETQTEPQAFEHIYQNLSGSQLISTMQATRSKTISFEIIISTKSYSIPPFKSWYPQRHCERFFGDIGEYQQRLMFYDEEGDQYVDLYLCNRENFAFPLGLIRHMKIRVNHINVNDTGKYLRTTPLTTFDILGYYPQNKYSCANLAVSGDGKWDFRSTPPSLFGADHYLPPNRIIHGLILFRAIYDLNLVIVCANCKYVNYQVDGCNRCNSRDLDAITLIIFNAEDGSAQQHFKMQTNSLEFLLDILTIKQEKKAMFLRAIQRYGGSIKFDLLKVPSDFQEPKSIVVEEMIQKLRGNVNFNRPIMLNVVAMKQHTPVKCPQKPWLVLDHEFVVPTNEVMIQ